MKIKLNNAKSEIQTKLRKFNEFAASAATGADYK